MIAQRDKKTVPPISVVSAIDFAFVRPAELPLAEINKNPYYMKDGKKKKLTKKSLFRGLS
ncbi:hypothetical protein COB52_02210 [Candidatus Kaiserbacteria bacterium]|nr:MAG: hypothetical protein COB52_02210 [Candidatus Kaiserbacteria bacterium]